MVKKHDVKSFDPEKFLASIPRAFEKPPHLSLTSPLRKLDGFDSLASVMLVAEIYADYRVNVSGEEMRACETVAELADLVRSKLAEGVS